MVMHLGFLLFTLLHHSYGHDEHSSSRKDRKCSRHQKEKKKMALWSWKKQRQLSRKAYRMAILASLAYHDFRDPEDWLVHDGYNMTNYNNTSWAFSLADDPPPAPYLAEYDDGSVSLSWEKRRNRIQRIVAGIVARFRVLFCQTRYKVARIVPEKLRLSKPYHRTNMTAVQQCKQKLLQKHEGGKRYSVDWVLNDWHEEKAKIRWHDTDLIIATSGKSDIVLAFAGTTSAADALTNLQTLEPASHSGLFNQKAVTNSTNSTVEGNIHRGFLNAYARVVRGKIRKINKNHSRSTSTKSLHDYFNKCIIQQHAPQSNSTAIATIKQNKSNNVIMKLVNKRKKRHDKKKDIMRKRNKNVCRSHENRLMDILRDVTTNSLQSGQTVHLVGHSLAGALATIHALDIVMNHVDTPIDRLHLWTFGAPEVADSLFFESAGTRSPRLRAFFSDDARFHRYVTQSEKNCATDTVASITSKSLNRRVVRRLGGVRGNVIHTIDPSFLLCNVSGAELHELGTYLSGLSLLSPKHTLSTDFSSQMKSWLGEKKGEEVEA